MVIKKQSPFVFVIIKCPSMKDIFIIDGLIGTGLFYVVKIVTASDLLGFIASTVGITGIKKIPLMKKRFLKK